MMTISNAHAQVLVDRINDLSRTEHYRKDFGDILLILAKRYEDEVYDKVITDEGDRETDLLSRIPAEEFIESCGREFLMLVCDNNDLNTILHYCKYRADHQYPNAYAELTYETKDGCFGEIVYAYNDRDEKRTTPAMVKAIKEASARIRETPITMESYLISIGRTNGILTR